MGQPQPAGPPTAQDTVSNVLGHVSNHHDSIEKRLTDLRDKIQARAQAGSLDQAQVPVAGLLSHALSVRNSAARIEMLVGEIENLL